MMGVNCAYCAFFLLLGTAVAIPGGWSNANVSSQGVQDAAAFASNEIDRRSNSMFKSRLLAVTKAETQVVGGINYRIVMTRGELDCRRNTDIDAAQCGVNKVFKCSVTVWSRPWLDLMELTDFNCDVLSSRSTRSITPEFHPGGHVPVDASSSQVKHAIEFAVGHFNSLSNDEYSVDFYQLVNGTQQVVAGLLLRMKLELLLSMCERTSRDTVGKLSSCDEDHVIKHLIECDVELWDQPWTNPRHTIQQYRCMPTPREPYLRQYTNDAFQHLIGGDHDVGVYEEFQNFLNKYGKVYSTDEEKQHRLEVFSENMKIARHIQMYDQGTATYGASPYADLTTDEFRKSFLTPKWDLSYDERLTPADIPLESAADDFDWRQHGAVTPVKNQGSCGSCWAFSVTGNIEGQWAIKKQKLIPLSEQELVDCDKLDDGCNGGLPANAYHEIQRLGGLETETEYPYKGEDEKCDFVRSEARVYINGSLNISKNEDDIKVWVYKNGPVSIGINAFAMQFYMGGISHPWKFFCEPDSLDHGVAIVGYGIHKGTFRTSPYWIVKNSWGPSWGEKGYYLVYRGDGVCGLNQMVSSAVVK